MPYYDFECDKCHIINEYYHTFKEVETAHHACPKCGRTMRRKISGGLGVIFKGEGWAGQDIKRNKGNPNG